MKHKERLQRNDSILTSEKPLQSWKEIAAYLEIGERTARRWEEGAALPVRRHGDGKRSSVYAYPNELDAWRLAREPRASQTPVRQGSVAVAIGVLGIALGGWFVFYGPVFNPPNPFVEAADGITLNQLWTGSAVDSTGRPSPDGRYLTCHVPPAGNLGIYELDSGKTKPLTDAAGWTEHVYYSVFSPDGQQVVYEWGRDETELRLVDLNGS